MQSTIPIAKTMSHLIPPSRWSRYKAKALKWYLPVGLIIALGVGIVWPQPGKWLAKTPLQSICIIIIFVVTGLKLDTREIR